MLSHGAYRLAKEPAAACLELWAIQVKVIVVSCGRRTKIFAKDTKILIVRPFLPQSPGQGNTEQPDSLEAPLDMAKVGNVFAKERELTECAGR